MTRSKAYVDLARPFTLVMRMLGMFSGAATAWGAHHAKPPVTGALLVPVVLGVLMAGIFNAANNAINQIYDLPIDRVNKPKRPLPSGTLTLGEAWVFTAVTYLLTWVLAWLTAPGGRHECFVLVAVAALLPLILSEPPLP